MLRHPRRDHDCDGNVFDDRDVCGGDGIPAGDCDCEGNQLDALGVCGGPCAADADVDGICDDVDNCTDLMACNYNEGNAVCAYLDEWHSGAKALPMRVRLRRQRRRCP